jgi:signal transduction histidine kinase
VSVLDCVPVRWKLTGAAVLLSAVALGLIAVAILASFRSELERGVDSDLNERTSALSRLIGDGGPAALRSAAADDILRPRGAVAQVLDRAGTVVAASSSAPTSALPHDRGRVTIAINRLGSRSRVHATALTTGRMLVVARSLGDQDRADGSLAHALLTTAPLVLLLVAGGAYVVTGRALRPVKDMSHRAASMSLAVDGGRLPVARADDELADLGRTLNDLLDRAAEAARHEHALVANASHELRTPLSRLRASLELAINQAPSHEATRSAIKDVRHLTALANDLLTLAALDEAGDTLGTQPVDLLELIDEIAADARTLSPDRPINVTGDPVVLEANAQAVRQAIGNLVTNAIVHGAGVVQVTVAADASHAEITVTDEGAGMDIPLTDATERFIRGPAAQRRPGAGLGLALVSAVARGHHGELSYADGIFTVRLPLTHR